ncbi:MAG TPA: hypothetical protein VGO11_08580 [Chthoniobacteraceae bacterium]|jgi:hypothetical protein|nr:hypothetical protein [Chthoniobacteraceae bacterium]
MLVLIGFIAVIMILFAFRDFVGEKGTEVTLKDARRWRAARNFVLLGVFAVVALLAFAFKGRHAAEPSDPYKGLGSSEGEANPAVTARPAETLTPEEEEKLLAEVPGESPELAKLRKEGRELLQKANDDFFRHRDSKEKESTRAEMDQADERYKQTLKKIQRMILLEELQK